MRIQFDRTTLKRCGRYLIEAAKNHYKSTTYVRTPEQIEREKFLIPRLLKFNRWFLVPAAVIIQFCCGSLYSWSVYNEPVEKYMYGQQTNTASVTFYLAVACLGVSAALFGPWLERHGPSKTAFIGVCGFFMGNMLASLAVYTKQMWLLYVGYGIIGGCSIGICYISPVSALQKFFPDKRGLASGFAVCGFGAGSIAASPLQLVLINNVGVPLTFCILGGSYFVFMILAAAVLRTPPPSYTVASLQNQQANGVSPTNLTSQKEQPPKIVLTLIQSLKTLDYWLMFGMFFGNVVPGLVVLSRLSNMVQDLFDKSKSDGAFVVAVNGGFNLAGRFIFSLLSDKIGRKTVFMISLCTQIIILGSMTPILYNKPDSYWVFVVFIWILASCYGCSFGVIPAFLADMFGPSNIGACHGVILIGWSIAGVCGGLTYTSIFNSLVKIYTVKDPIPYLVNFYWLLSIVITALLLTFFIRTNGWHRYFATQSSTRAIFVTLFRYLLIFQPQRCRVELLSAQTVREKCLELERMKSKENSQNVRVENGNVVSINESDHKTELKDEVTNL